MISSGRREGESRRWMVHVPGFSRSKVRCRRGEQSRRRSAVVVVRAQTHDDGDVGGGQGDD
ncbi:hypothetical protein DVH24_023631 [Malus domestica]|uniref:Uncharacterized protein n=1 Tax=Malus domestica TaxID=3750 RepID=A0A498I5Y6_MALDO|nr:hypothetical protein DVH24_023631 [Malus domestica]